MRRKDHRIIKMDNMTPAKPKLKPLIEPLERDRAAASLKVYKMTEEERLAYIEKYPIIRGRNPNVLRWRKEQEA